MARFVENDLPKSKINASSLNKAKLIFKYAGNHKWKFYVGLFFLLLTSITALAFPKFLGLLVDCVANKDAAKANKIALGLFGILILQSCFSFFRLSLFINFTENTLANLRFALYQNLIKLPMSFYAQKRVGELNSRLSADISQLQDTLTSTIAEFLRQFILIIGGFIILATISPKLTLMMMSIVPVVAVAAVIFGRFIRKYGKKTQDKIAESQVVVEETLQGITNVKAFANEWYEIERYKNKINEIVKIAIKGGQYRGFFASFIIICLFGAVVSVVWYGVTLTISGEMKNVGQLISFVLYSAFIGASFGGIAELYSQLQKAIGSTERIFELLEETPEKISGIQSSIKEKIKGEVTFQNVAFTYPSRKEIQVLKDVSFKASFGQKIAIVGPSGAGKSTISSLLLRFYDIESGTILIDDKNIYDYDLENLRGNMSIVPQDVILFGGSIKENIAYGKPDATEEEIIIAAKQANALNFVNGFPEKFDTVGERGIKLSGGQRQRIAIARALLKNPSILILDEATSSLDSESEKLVQEALETLMEGRTSIIIAHRLSTIRNADAILVLDNGIIAEQGTHKELIEIENGIYKNLSNLQFRDY
ncbi:ABC transporter ATP-binding protein [Flavobacterium psychrophilum]|uniref:ABC transporter ATP-binding protein n=1 Tax=Flavobacterium psychrophilum TaxID=96345 RepID=UPI0039854EE3